MSQVKALIEEYQDHPAFQGHPWDPLSPSHWVEEPEKECCGCRYFKPVSELLRYSVFEIVCQECQVETASILAEMQADIQDIAADWARNALPEPATIQKIAENAAKLAAMWG